MLGNEKEPIKICAAEEYEESEEELETTTNEAENQDTGKVDHVSAMNVPKSGSLGIISEETNVERDAIQQGKKKLDGNNISRNYCRRCTYFCRRWFGKCFWYPYCWFIPHVLGRRCSELLRVY